MQNENKSDSLEGAMPLQHLKRVSRIKHVILQKYLPPWKQILGSAHNRLCYFDCYAGPGVYEFKGEKVEGSPLIAVRAAKGYLSSSRTPEKELVLFLVERDDHQRQILEKALEPLKPYGERLKVAVVNEDAKDFIPRLLDSVPKIAPSFFFVDPYGHPLTIPILNQILQRPYTEALVNFMYYRINMDAGNPKAEHLLDRMFESKEWREQPFLSESGQKREQGFLSYFLSKIQAKYKLQFRIRFDPEDKMSEDRTKYYLIHASNSPKAVLLMKEVMWPLGDEEGVFDYRGAPQEQLFSSSPREEELEGLLVDRYRGKTIAFDQLREETWELPFIEKHYRAVINKLRKEGSATVTPVSSKTGRGIKGYDRILIKDVK